MSSINQELVQAEAQWVLGLLKVERLPEWAASHLSSGIESEDIVQLAICSPDEKDHILRLFTAILKTGGCGNMLKIDALRNIARQISASIVTEKVSPQEGARRIWDAAIRAGHRDFHELDPFIYAASEIDVRPNDKEFFEHAIREEAKRWIARRSE